MIRYSEQKERLPGQQTTWTTTWHYNVCDQCAKHIPRGPNYQILVVFSLTLLLLALVGSTVSYWIGFVCGFLAVVLYLLARSQNPKKIMTDTCVGGGAEEPVLFLFHGWGKSSFIFRRKDYADAFAQLNSINEVKRHSKRPDRFRLL
jgi:hypothetical protein